ncbi:LTA synthase family protein [Bacillus sp. HMF5848]|uniref:LTA synthase family protein n=1 Tax=Bacillus sp. HMF5848 TaxID=2495421 RepID=UPI000F76BDF4|nr:LTA synthase family protein [Bacillus sp. HMF5848]RSK28380.1 LTA synthase family protein [Bacillus sp. HMF5848]
MQRFKGKLPIIWISIFTLWAKTTFAVFYIFHIHTEDSLQVATILINPLAPLLLLMSLALLFVGKKNAAFIAIAINLAVTLLLYFNIVYYRFFNDFLTIPILLQSNNARDLGISLWKLLEPVDILFFIDIIIAFWLKGRMRAVLLFRPKVGLSLACILFFINLTTAHIDRPELLTRSFDRQMLVRNLGIYNYVVYDVLLHGQTKIRRAAASERDYDELNKHVLSDTPANPAYSSIAKGRNVFVISLESTQSFVVNEYVDEQELTPFLNDLITEKGSYYFDQFYHQTSQGKTSDSEFIIDNSLYGLPRGAVFFTNPQNKYNALPKRVKEAGYTTAVFHANNKSFWNRDVMYPALGYDHFFSEMYYTITKENSVGWGLKDADFFMQSLEYVKKLQQPFYAKFITLTNHFPFALAAKDEIIPEWNSPDGTVNRYFTTVRYQDEALKQFFDAIKASGLYDNSIFIIYGDHYGISKNHNKAMSTFLQKDITAYEYIQLQKVPMLIHVPGLEETKTVSTISGQIDVKPTILNLLGLEQGHIQFGTDLFASNREELIILRDGSFISDTYVYTNNRCYSHRTSMETNMHYCEPFFEHVKEELELSDKIIYGDLLRFAN